jgi:phospholipid/cholesterol/gamma-HCH transport system ATP-binding protein
LFCDEPNSGLDPQTSLKIDELIKEITEEYNITTIIVTHDMNSVIEIGDKIMFLYEGKKLWEGTRDEIMDTDIQELNDFIFANRLMRDAKRVEEEDREEEAEESISQPAGTVDQVTNSNNQESKK